MNPLRLANNDLQGLLFAGLRFAAQQVLSLPGNDRQRIVDLMRGACREFRQALQLHRLQALRLAGAQLLQRMMELIAILFELFQRQRGAARSRDRPARPAQQLGGERASPEER